VEGFTIAAILTISFVLFLYCYIEIIIAGPGYFPFYYQPRANLPVMPNDRYEISGIMSIPEQEAFVQTHDGPPRSMFSRTARRYVLRPDHVCVWAASWIGKLNQKYFILFCFHGILYCGLFTAYSLRFAIGSFIQHKITVIPILFAIFSIPGIVFLAFIIRFFASSLINMVRGVTNWEIWNRIKTETFDRGSKIDNIADVMGERPMWRWILPLDPFPGKAAIDLIDGYAQYEKLPADGGIGESPVVSA
jgi:hypothetical protein